MRLLIPQHWSKEYMIQTGNTSNQSTQEEIVVITWNDNKNTKTISLDNTNNIATMNMSPNTKDYRNYAKTFYEKHKEGFKCQNIKLVE